MRILRKGTHSQSLRHSTLTTVCILCSGWQHVGNTRGGDTVPDTVGALPVLGRPGHCSTRTTRDRCWRRRRRQPRHGAHRHVGLLRRGHAPPGRDGPCATSSRPPSAVHSAGLSDARRRHGTRLHIIEGLPVAMCSRRSLAQGLFAPPPLAYLSHNLGLTSPPMAARHSTAQNGAARGDSEPPPFPPSPYCTQGTTHSRVTAQGLFAPPPP